MNSKLFGTSGIRGTLHTLTVEKAFKIGVTIAKFFEKSPIVMCRDHRRESYPVYEAVKAGITSAGVDVLDLGELPTTAMLHYLRHANAHGGIAVTGSHTPPGITGVLIFGENTAELSTEKERLFEKLYSKLEMEKTWEDVERIGKVFSISLKDIVKAYVTDLSKIVNKSLLRDFEGAIGFDACSSTAGVVYSRILSNFGVKVITVDAHLDPTFSSRDPYPRPDNLTNIARITKKLGLSFSISIDGDGDRCIFTCENGLILYGDVSAILLAEHELENLKAHIETPTIVCPVNTSNIVKYLSQRYRCKIVYTKVGPPRIVEKMVELKPNVIFGFEETGKYIYPDNVLYGDPVLATLKMIEIIAEKRESLSQLVRKLPRLYQIKKSVKCPEKYKEKLLKRMRFKWSKKKNVNKIYTIDGLRVEFKDGAWILFRPSGTEPVFRCYVEARTPERAENLSREGIKDLKRALRRLKRVSSES
ncbi:hypothetical protein DRO02_01935 [archaeon]|nr:MAG: hypothetical protein DRO02_01935 [archaeon]